MLKDTQSYLWCSSQEDQLLPSFPDCLAFLSLCLQACFKSDSSARKRKGIEKTVSRSLEVGENRGQ